MPDLLTPLAEWYAAHARPLPWRAPDRTAWGVLVSEIMSQQTPMSRVEPYWAEWMKRWPHPRDLDEAATADVLRAWGTLGYPRRALRLQECAAVIVADHGGEVPADETALRALPGIGAYTAAAVAAFAYGKRALVLDTNIRRVLARTIAGTALQPPSPTAAEHAQAEAWLPADPAQSVMWNQAVMELGALHCTARAPACETCPLAQSCAWRLDGQPADAFASRRRGQAWAGTDRQARGRIMALLRAAPDDTGVPVASVDAAWPRREQAERALAGLLADGLAEQQGDQIFLSGASARPAGQKAQSS